MPPTVWWEAGPSLPPAPESWQWWVLDKAAPSGAPSYARDSVALSRKLNISPKIIFVGLAIFVLVIVIFAEQGGSHQSSISSQADAVMQLNDTPFDISQSPGTQAIQVINSAENAFNAAVTVTNDPTQQDDDYTKIGVDLQQVQQYIQSSLWSEYYVELGQARSDIESARADGTLTGP
jgi:hypothetical protein